MYLHQYNQWPDDAMMSLKINKCEILTFNDHWHILYYISDNNGSCNNVYKDCHYHWLHEDEGVWEVEKVRNKRKRDIWWKIVGGDEDNNDEDDKRL